MRRIIFAAMVLAFGAALAAVYSGSAVAQKKGAGANGNWIEGVSDGRNPVVDMTYAVSDKFPAWPGDERVFEAKANATVAKDGYFTRSFWMLEHYGTHMDAPIHFPPGKTPVDQIPPKQFFGMAAVFDVRAQAAANADYQIPPARIREW